VKHRDHNTEDAETSNRQEQTSDDCAAERNVSLEQDHCYSNDCDVEQQSQARPQPSHGFQYNSE